LYSLSICEPAEDRQHATLLSVSDVSTQFFPVFISLFLIFAAFKLSLFQYCEVLTDFPSDSLAFWLAATMAFLVPREVILFRPFFITFSLKIHW
jgi:hypothetical protein